jgi:hypothetical protein
VYYLAFFIKNNNSNKMGVMDLFLLNFRKIKLFYCIFLCLIPNSSFFFLSGKENEERNKNDIIRNQFVSQLI